jgi:Skp family chaperone for outer membrane proteins
MRHLAFGLTRFVTALLALTASMPLVAHPRRRPKSRRRRAHRLRRPPARAARSGRWQERPRSTLEAMKSRPAEGSSTRCSTEARKKLKAAFDTQKAMMKDDVRRQREEELAEKLGRLQMLYATLQKELAGKEAELTKDIFKRMAKILEKMGREQKWTMIFEKTESSVLWAEQSLDLTNELIRRYNAGEGK